MNVAFPLYWFCSSPMCGIMTMQGPHHVAQNSTTYTLPAAYSFSSGLPHFVAFTGGVGSPTFREALSVSVARSAAGAQAVSPRTSTAANSVRMGLPFADGVRGGQFGRSGRYRPIYGGYPAGRRIF